MNEIRNVKESLKKTRAPYGRMKALAIFFGVDPERAYAILNGRIYPTPADKKFLEAYKDEAKQREQSLTF